MSAFAFLIARRICQLIDDFAKVNGLGVAVHEWVFLLDPARPLTRRPDAAFVSFQRWPADREVPEFGEWEVVPDLAIGSHEPERPQPQAPAEAPGLIFRYGVRQVWVVHPESREVAVYHSPKRAELSRRGRHTRRRRGLAWVPRGGRRPVPPHAGRLTDLINEGEPRFQRLRDTLFHPVRLPPLLPETVVRRPAVRYPGTSPTPRGPASSTTMPPRPLSRREFSATILGGLAAVGGLPRARAATGRAPPPPLRGRARHPRLPRIRRPRRPRVRRRRRLQVRSAASNPEGRTPRPASPRT